MKNEIFAKILKNINFTNFLYSTVYQSIIFGFNFQLSFCRMFFNVKKSICRNIRFGLKVAKGKSKNNFKRKIMLN